MLQLDLLLSFEDILPLSQKAWAANLSSSKIFSQDITANPVAFEIILL